MKNNYIYTAIVLLLLIFFYVLFFHDNKTTNTVSTGVSVGNVVIEAKEGKADTTIKASKYLYKEKHLPVIKEPESSVFEIEKKEENFDLKATVTTYPQTDSIITFFDIDIKNKEIYRVDTFRLYQVDTLTIEKTETIFEDHFWRDSGIGALVVILIEFTIFMFLAGS